MHCFMHGGEILNLLSSGIDRVCSLVDTVHDVLEERVADIFVAEECDFNSDELSGSTKCSRLIDQLSGYLVKKASAL